MGLKGFWRRNADAFIATAQALAAPIGLITIMYAAHQIEKESVTVQDPVSLQFQSYRVSDKKDRREVYTGIGGKLVDLGPDGILERAEQTVASRHGYSHWERQPTEAQQQLYERILATRK